MIISIKLYGLYGGILKQVPPSFFALFRTLSLIVIPYYTPKKLSLSGYNGYNRIIWFELITLLPIFKCCEIGINNVSLNSKIYIKLKERL